jgi:anaerobic selenocysteine-containing dehydrogenase
MSDTVKTFCRNCGALCSMEIELDQGRMLRARPDGSVSPYGPYMCPKGTAAVELHNGMEARLQTALQRQSDGGFSPVDAEAAMDAIGAKLAALVAQHGPRSVAVYHGTGAYRSTLGGLMERAWVAALGTPNFFSTMTIDQSAKWVTMARMGVMASGKHQMRDADLLLLAGGNPLVSHQGAPFAVAESGAPARAFEAARERGAKVIIIDPRRTETARFADLLIQPLPGHDAEIFAAIAHVLLRGATHDHAFTRCWCIQLDELRTALAPFTPELAAQRADVPVEQILLAAKWLSAAEKPIVGSGTGPSFATHSNLADHMIETVNALAGGYRREGDVVRNPGTLKPKDTFEMAVSPSRSFAGKPKCLSQNIGPLFGEFPSSLIPGEITADSPDRIRALIVFGGDPLVAMGDPRVAKAAFEKLDLLVSLDCRMNETAKLADYVIATTQPFERADLSVAGDALFPEAFVQYTPPVVARAPGVIDDWEFFWGVAARMGLPLTFKYWNYGLKFEDVQPGLPLDMTVKPTADELLRFLCSASAVPFDEIRASPGGVRPAGAARKVLPAPSDLGRLELCPEDVAGELAALAQTEPEAGYHSRLISRRILHAINGAYRDSREARRRYPVNYAWMNPDDMAEAGIAENGPVEIASEFGKLRTLARAAAGPRRGVVSMTHMYGPLESSGDVLADGGANLGQLTSLSDQLQPINFMPRFSAVPINVCPA